MDFTKIAVLFYPFLSWIYGCLSELYTTYDVVMISIYYYVVDIREEIDYDTLGTDHVLHRCRDGDKESRTEPDIENKFPKY